MSASRMIRNGRATRFTRRVLLATASLMLAAAACTGEAGVEETAADGSGALDEPAQPADRPVQPPPMALGALAYFLDGDLYVAKWDGGNPLRIANGRPPGDCSPGSPGEYWGEGPIWSPDGRYLAYRHWDCAGPRDAWWGVEISDPEGNLVASFPGEGWLISWSPDSTRVAVWIRWGETIGVYGLDGERQVLTLPPGLMAPGDYDPVWSRDGESLLVPNGVEIPLDGRTPRPLPSSDPRVYSQVTYSPDGSRVAYTAAGSLVVAETDGSHPQEVSGSWVWNPAWSPTGDRIAFAYSERAGIRRTELRVIDVATGTVTSLAGVGGSDLLWVIEFSPEGNRILFRRTEDAGRGDYLRKSSLWSINADGSDARRLVTGTPWGDWLSPSPTG